MTKAKKPATKAKKRATKAKKPATKAKKPPGTPPKPSSDDRWWELIERSRKDVDGDTEQAEKLVALMTAELSADEIVAFGRFLEERVRDAFRGDLWGVAYIMNGGCSDDGFDYFLGWLICQGKKRYQAALANPEAAATGISPDDEPFENEVVYWGPATAWGAKTGRPRDDYYQIAPGVTRTLQGELFDEDSVFEQHPKLAKKFGG